MPLPPLHILIVSQMYPSAKYPDLGIFVHDIGEALEQRGHRVGIVAVTRRGGGIAKHLGFAARTVSRIVTMRPDVVYVHFLFPAGLWAALGCILARRKFVITAHGRDVRNITEKSALVRRLSRFVVRRAHSIICVSAYLGAALERAIPETRGHIEIIDSGVDTDRFAPQEQAVARQKLGLGGRVTGGEFLFVGTFDERKNVLRLVEAWQQLGQGRLTLVGDGPLRAQLQQVEGVQLVGQVQHDEVATWVAASDVLCLPSTVEPFGQVLIEAMSGARSVVATLVGGPPEFVTDGVGVCVDPTDTASIANGMREAAQLPVPNHAARDAALSHDIHVQVSRIEVLLRAATE